MPDPARRDALTIPSYIVLGLVRTLGKATPYELKAVSAAALCNFWEVRHAQYYSEPDRIAALGFLTMEQEATGRRRKTYRITPAGEQALAEWLESPAASAMEFRDEALLKIWFGADPKTVAQTEADRHAAQAESVEQGLETFGPILSEGQRRVMQIGLALQRVWVHEWQAIADGKPTG